jgi:predicted Zn-dependent protease
MKSLLSIVLMLALSLSLAACKTNPATGERNLNFISTEQEISLGTQAEPQFLSEYGGEIPSAEVRAYVSDLGQRLAAVSERRDLPWEFHVIDSSVINAFALPGGKVFMSRGLMEKLNSEAELAGVLGHEIGHVTAQHIGQQMSQAMAVQGLATAVGVAGQATNNDYLAALGVGTQAGGTLYLLKFGRDQESQADELGVRYMARLGYNPMGQVRVMEVLKAASGGGGGIEMLQTHPLPETRIKRLTKHIQQTFPDYNDPSKYRTNEAEYRSRALSVLAKLPRAKHGGESGQSGGTALQRRQRRSR